MTSVVVELTGPDMVYLHRSWQMWIRSQGFQILTNAAMPIWWIAIGGHPFELGSTDWLYKGNIIEHLHESMLFLFFFRQRQANFDVCRVCLCFFYPRFYECPVKLSSFHCYKCFDVLLLGVKQHIYIYIYNINVYFWLEDSRHEKWIIQVFLSLG